MEKKKEKQIISAIIGMIIAIFLLSFAFCRKAPSVPVEKKNQKEEEKNEKQVTEPKPIELYKVLSGNVEEIELPKTWKEYHCKKVLRSKEGKAKIRLAGKAVIEMEGTIAVGAGPRECGIIEGGAAMEIEEGKKAFQVVNRVGVIHCNKKASFKVAVKELPGQPKLAPGENGARLELQVGSGQVNFVKAGWKKGIPVAPGQNKVFLLAQIKKNGEIRALGFGISKLKGPRAKIIKKRAAKTSAQRCLAEFSHGMKFHVATVRNKYSFTEASFKTEGQISPKKLEYQDLTQHILMCIASADIPLVNAENRRYYNVKSGEGATLLTLNKNLPMALQSARNNAILEIIRQSAQEIYGELPEQAKGMFYPTEFRLEKEGDKAIAKVSGEVVFE